MDVTISKRFVYLKVRSRRGLLWTIYWNFGVHWRCTQQPP